MEFRTEMRKDLNGTRLRLRVSGVYTEDYQLRMLRENQIGGLTVISARGEGEETVYEYDITGLTSLRTYYKQKKITEKEMKDFLIRLRETVENTGRYLLNPNRLLLDPEYVFFGEKGYLFCYFPQGEEDIRQTFHRLMDEFVQWTDYQDVSSVKTAFLLHKETMRENYSLGSLVKQLEELEAEAAAEADVQTKPETETGKPEERERYVPEEVRLRREMLWGEDTYDTKEHDWITGQEMGSKILKETDNLWTPVKRLLHRRHRPKWGEWDGVYIDEEEL